MIGEAFDALVRSFDPGMAVVTAAEGDELAGCLVGFHGQTSIDPLRYGVWLSKANHTYRVASRTTFLGVHMLVSDGLAAARHRDLAELFGTASGDDVDKFAGLAHERGPGGVPLLTECPHRLAIRRSVLLDDGGDHVCMTGPPVAATTTGPFRPLRLEHVAHLVPGHAVEDRPHPPTERAADA
jgi:flavin reductase (DIM6/NTAB) family NADH-FMN oxidoreductase RutF